MVFKKGHKSWNKDKKGKDSHIKRWNKRGNQMREVIIGCPVKNDYESFKAMYRSLVDSVNLTTFNKFVIAVGEGTNEMQQNELREYRMLTVLDGTFKTPLEAYNALFKYALDNESDLLLTQTDVVFPKLYKRDWLLQMKEVAKDERVGAVTCINGGGISGPDYIDGLEWLGGHCTYIPFRTISKLGGYDKEFPNGQYGVDIDYTYRIHLLGLKIVKINYWVDHHMMNERLHDNHPDTERHKQDCAIYFRRKYKLGEFKDA